MKAIRTAVLVILGIIWLLPAYLLVVNAMKDPTTFTTWEQFDRHHRRAFEAHARALVERVGS